MAGPPYLARLLDLDTLDSLKSEMTRIAVSRPGLPIMSSKGVQRLILLEQIPTPAANIIKQEILARGGDLATPWSAVGFEVPTVDVLLIGNLTTLRSTISKLYRQPFFNLPQIADAIQKVVVHTTPGYLPVAPKPNRQGVVVEETLEDLMGGRVPLEKGSNRATGRPTLVSPGAYTWRLGEMTYVMGTVKATPDHEHCRQRIAQVAAEGAHMMAIGCEPATVDAAGERAMLLPLIRHTREVHPDVLIAVEAQHPEIASEAVAAGAQFLNDRTSRQRNREVWQVAAATGLPLVINHRQNITARVDPVADVARFFWHALNEAIALGVQEEQIVLDAGLGTGKSPEQDLLLIRRHRELTSFGRPLLYTPPPQPSIGELAAIVAAGIARGADIVRVHDVADAARCAKMSDSLVRGT